MIFACITVAFVAVVASFTVLRLRSETADVRKMAKAMSEAFSDIEEDIDIAQKTAQDALDTARSAANAKAIRGR